MLGGYDHAPRTMDHVNLYIYFENVGRLSTMHHVPTSDNLYI